jgi:hypothetical protein
MWVMSSSYELGGGVLKCTDVRRDRHLSVLCDTVPRDGLAVPKQKQPPDARCAHRALHSMGDYAGPKVKAVLKSAESPLN